MRCVFNTGKSQQGWAPGPILTEPDRDRASLVQPDIIEKYFSQFLIFKIFIPHLEIRVLGHGKRTLTYGTVPKNWARS